MGLRRGDPGSCLQHVFEPSSDWLGPDISFMRINPILHWGYADVWTFLRTFNISYCPLYDDGYSSIGTIDNTARNALLLQESSQSYLPAYRLVYPQYERLGRQLPASPVPPAHTSSLSLVDAGVVNVQHDVLLNYHPKQTIQVPVAEMLTLRVAVRRMSFLHSAPADIAAELQLQLLASDVTFLILWNANPTLLNQTLQAVAQILGLEAGPTTSCSYIWQHFFPNDSLCFEAPHNNDVCRFSPNNLAPTGVSAAPELRGAQLDLPNCVIVHELLETKIPVIQCGSIFIVPGLSDALPALMTSMCRTLVAQWTFSHEQLST